jgi:hypothetical protein
MGGHSAAATAPPPPPPAPQDAAAMGEAHSSCPGYEVLADTDLLHGDMQQTPSLSGSTLAECCAECERSRAQGCVGATRTSGGECWLKLSADSPMKQRGVTSAIRGTAQERAAAAVAAAEAAARSRAASAAAASTVSSVGSALAPTVPLGAGCSRDPAVGCMASPAVVVMSHDRPEMTRRALRQLLGLKHVDRFAVYVSEDAGSREVVAAAREFPNVKEVLSSRPALGASRFKKGGLHKISQHFRHALEATLTARGHSHVVMVRRRATLITDD